MGCNQKSFTILVVWRWRQPMSGSLPNGRLSRVSRRLDQELFSLPSYLLFLRKKSLHRPGFEPKSPDLHAGGTWFPTPSGLAVGNLSVKLDFQTDLLICHIYYFKEKSLPGPRFEPKSPALHAGVFPLTPPWWIHSARLENSSYWQDIKFCRRRIC